MTTAYFSTERSAVDDSLFTKEWDQLVTIALAWDILLTRLELLKADEYDLLPSRLNLSE